MTGRRQMTMTMKQPQNELGQRLNVRILQVYTSASYPAKGDNHTDVLCWYWWKRRRSGSGAGSQQKSWTSTENKLAKKCSSPYGSIGRDVPAGVPDRDGGGDRKKSLDEAVDVTL